MIVTTTPSIEGKPIKDYLGIVRDIFAGITDIIGGRAGAYEAKLSEARRTAIQEMRDAAAHLAANAIVGVDIDYEVVRDGMLMVTASGTAVNIVPEPFGPRDCHGGGRT